MLKRMLMYVKVVGSWGLPDYCIDFGTGCAVAFVWYLLVSRHLQFAFALNNLDEMRQHQVLDDVHPVWQDIPHNVEHGVK